VFLQSCPSAGTGCVHRRRSDQGGLHAGSRRWARERLRSAPRRAL